MPDTVQLPDWNPLQSVADLVGQKIAADRDVALAARQTFDSAGDGYAVDAYGNSTPRGKVAVSSATLAASPLLYVGGAIAAAVLLYVAFKK